MVRFPLLLGAMLARQALSACDACEKDQPNLTRGLTHGPGPSGSIEIIIAGLAFVLVIISLCFSIRYLLHPGEKNPGHIKHFINQEFEWNKKGQ